ncbi:MAG TPA: ABC transporter permease [Solirubrobacteraceae bacterium]|nr:ABC transporter permease [Solirubrobacteraceae bacterium]
MTTATGTPAAVAAGGGDGGSRLKARLTRVSRAAWIGWGGIALGLLAFYTVLPPILVRTMIVSVVFALAGVALGVIAIRGGEKRIGWGAIAACVIGIAGAYGAVNSGVTNLERVIVWSALLAAALRYATPLIFAALGGVTSERAGVVNIGLEGMMLTGAFFGAWGADLTSSWLGGTVIGLGAGALMGLVHAIFAVTLRADQIISGTAINFLAVGITGFLFVKKYGTQGTPDDLPAIPNVHLPIEWIPFVGDALSDLNLMIWVGLIAAAVLSVFLFRTRGGLRLRSVGENPLAADTAGISPIRVRYLAVIASGAFAALGGVFLSIGFVHSFNEQMTAGKGFIGLAVVIVGKWKPGGAVAAALLFGFSSALAQRLPTFSPSIATLLQALPYVITLIAVAGLVGRSRPPAADGIPYER